MLSLYLESVREGDEEGAKSQDGVDSSQDPVSFAVMKLMLPSLRHAANELMDILICPQADNAVWKKMFEIKSHLFDATRSTFTPDGEQILRWREIISKLPDDDSAEPGDYNMAAVSLANVNVATVLRGLYNGLMNSDLLPDFLQQLDEAFPAQLIPLASGYEAYSSHEDLVDMAITIRTQRLICMLRKGRETKEAVNPLKLVAAVFCQPSEGSTVADSLENPFKPVGEIDVAGDPVLLDRYVARINEIRHRLGPDKSGVNVESFERDFELREASEQCADWLAGLHYKFGGFEEVNPFEPLFMDEYAMWLQ